MIRKQKSEVARKWVGDYLVIVKGKTSSYIGGLFYDVFVYKNNKFQGKADLDEVDKFTNTMKLFKSVKSVEDVKQIVSSYRDRHSIDWGRRR